MRLFALVALTLVAACREPVAPTVAACEDDYRPAMCLDGEEVCETDDRGCRLCHCDEGEGTEIE